MGTGTWVVLNPSPPGPEDSCMLRTTKICRLRNKQEDKSTILQFLRRKSQKNSRSENKNLSLIIGNVS